MKNKKAKQMICSVLNRNGGKFGYRSLIDPKSSNFAMMPNSYALRERGRPIRLSLVAASSAANQLRGN